MNVKIYGGFMEASLLREDLYPFDECLSALSKEISMLYNKDDTSSMIELARTFLEISDLKLKQSEFSGDALKCYTDAAKHLKYVDAIVKKIRMYTLSGEEISEVEVLEQDYHNKISTINDSIVETISIIECKIPQCSNFVDEGSLSRKGDLQVIRAHVKSELQAKEDEGKRFDVGSEFTENIYKCTTGGMKQYLANLFWDAERIIGEPPCKYSVIGLGSMALGQITPYSDLEFAILTENEEYKNHENQRVKDYFKNLCHYIHFKVILLGETVIKDYGVDLTHVMKRGTQFDPGDKTPLGGGGKYTLIQTVDGMMRLLKDDAGVKKVGLDVQHIIEKTCFVCESDGESFKCDYEEREGSIAEEYQNKVENFLQELGDGVHQNCLLRGIERLTGEVFFNSNEIKGLKLKGNIEEFDFRPRTTGDEGKTFNIKYEIYRLADRFIYNLSLVCNLVDPELSTWDVLKKLVDMGELSEEGGSNLMEALSFATILRLKVYDHYEGQKERVDFRGASDLGEVLLRKEDLSENGSLFEFYYKVLPLIYLLKDFSNAFRDGKILKGFFSEENFYGDALYGVGNIHLKLLNYDEGLLCYEKLLSMEVELLEPGHVEVAMSLNNIGLIYHESGRYQEALAKYEESLNIRKQIHQDTPDKDIAGSLLNIGRVYEALEHNVEAIEKYEGALGIYRTIYGNKHSHVVMSLNNIGKAYSNLKHNQKALETYIEALSISRELYGDKNEFVAIVLNNIGFVCSDLGLNVEALEKYEEGLSIYREIYGDHHPHVADSLNGIGIVYQNLGRSQEALEKCEEALGIWMEAYGNKHPSVARSLNNIGAVYSALGRKQEALEKYEESLSIKREVYGDRHPSVANILNNIGNVYDDLGRKQEALEKYEESLSIKREVYGNKHPDVATSLHNTGIVYSNLRLYQEALGKYEEALSIKREVYGNRHPNVADILNDIANVYKYSGRNGEALEKYKEALSVEREVYGSKSSSVAASLNNIANVCKDLRRNGEALEKYEAALSVEREVYGSKSPYVATSLNNIGSVCDDLGRKFEALEKYWEALSMRREMYGNIHPDVATSLNNIGATLDDLGRKQEALEKYWEALSIRRAVYGNKHPSVATCLNNIGAVYWNFGRSQEALEKYEEALSIRREVYKEKHPDIADSLNNIGIVYLHSGKVQECLEKFKEALSIYRETSGNKHLDVADALGSIGAVYKTLGSNKEALEAFVEASQIYEHFLGANHPRVQSAVSIIEKIEIQFVAEIKEELLNEVTKTGNIAAVGQLLEFYDDSSLFSSLTDMYAQFGASHVIRTIFFPEYTEQEYFELVGSQGVFDAEQYS